MLTIPFSRVALQHVLYDASRARHTNPGAAKVQSASGVGDDKLFFASQVRKNFSKIHANAGEAHKAV